MAANQIVTSTSFLNSLDQSPTVFEPLSLALWLELAVQRNTHPLCILFARQCEALFLASRPDDLGMLTLRQLSKLSEDLVYYETHMNKDSLVVNPSKRDDIGALVESRIGKAAAVLFMMVYDEVANNIRPSVKLLLLGKVKFMDGGFIDALLTHNEDLGALNSQAFADLLTPTQKRKALLNIVWVESFCEYLPRLYIELLTKLPQHPHIISAGEHTDTVKLMGYGKTLMSRFMQGVCYLPENHRAGVLKVLVQLGSTMPVMKALRAFTGHEHLLANVPLSLAMLELDNPRNNDYAQLRTELNAYINGESSSNSIK